MPRIQTRSADYSTAALQRDWTYVIITLIVLAVLGYSLLCGAL